MIEVRNDANSVVYESYKYGVGNRRLVSESGGMRTYYAGGGGQASVEYVEAINGGSLTWSKTFIYMGGSLLATISPSGASEYVEYHHPDRLGTRLTTNNLNTSSYEQAALPYGTALDAESTGATNRRFTSYDRSPSTGLDYAVNRTYDSAQGRFTQVDPIGAGASSLSDPQSWNMYAYCGNDPVNHTDPSGLFFKKLFRGIAKAFKWIAVALAVALAVAAVGVGIGILPAVFGWTVAKSVTVLALTSGALFASAFGANRLSTALSGIASLGIGGFGRIGRGGTASTFPGNSLQGGEIVDYGDVINFPSKPAYDSYWAYLRAQVGAIGRGISNAIGKGALYGTHYYSRYRAWADPFVRRAMIGPPCFETGECIGGTVTIVGPIANPGGLGGAIASGRAGHDAFIKHALERGEFAGLGIRTRGQFAEFVNGIQRNATGSNIRNLSGGRTAYWDPSTGTVVIRNPNVSDLGTAFRPITGRQYFDTLR